MAIKKLSIFLLIIISLSVLIINNVNATVSLITLTTTPKTPIEDWNGNMYAYGSTYFPTSISIENSQPYVYVGQQKSGGVPEYTVYRTYITFDTSNLTLTMKQNITSVIVSLYFYADDSATDFGIKMYVDDLGAEWTVADWNTTFSESKYLGEFWATTSGKTIGQYYNTSLISTYWNLINEFSETTIAFVSTRDINNNAPTSFYEYVTFTRATAKLYITYESTYPEVESVIIANPTFSESMPYELSTNYEYNFSVVVSDIEGTDDIHYVELCLNLTDSDLEFDWIRVTDNFLEINDYYNRVIINSDSSDSTEYLNSWIINFRIYFNSNFTETLTDIFVKVVDISALSTTEYYYGFYIFTDSQTNVYLFLGLFGLILLIIAPALSYKLCGGNKLKFLFMLIPLVIFGIGLLYTMLVVLS